jgi:hypothetical protein
MPAALSDPDSNDHDFIKRIGPAPQASNPTRYYNFFLLKREKIENLKYFRKNKN